MKDQIQESSGNVFADIGVPKPQEALAKATLVSCIVDIIGERGLTQTEAARLLGTNQARVSDLMRGRLAGFSTDRLFRFLNALNRDVEIVIKKKTSDQARVTVTAG